MNSKQAGFTLVELVVGIAMMMLIMASVSGVLTALVRDGMQGVDLINRQQEMRWTVDMIAQDIRYATNYYNSVDSKVSSVDLIRMNSQDPPATVRVRYSTVDTGNGNYVLQREVWIPWNNVAPTATNIITNPSRGYVGATDFTVKTEGDASGQVTKAEIMYKIRSSSTDTSGSIAQTVVYLSNKGLLSDPK